MLNARLIFLVVVLLAILSTGAYVWSLQARLERCSVALVEEQAKTERLTRDRADFEAKRQEALQQVEVIRAERDKAKARIKTVVIPTTCDGALDFLSKEVGR